MRKSSLLLVVVLIVSISLVSGCGLFGGTGGKAPKGASNGGARSKALSQPDAPVVQTTEFVRKFAVIETNKGKIVFQLFPHKAPKTVANFIKLVESGFFDGIKWHRVEPGYVIQAGDPLSMDNNPKNDGLGGPGYTIKAEINDVPHLKGTVAMAHNKKDVNSAGSQFYICLDVLPQLDGGFTVFGQVNEGMDVVEKIRYYDVIKTIYIEERP